jgi:cytochrome c oxidase subunit III
MTQARDPTGSRFGMWIFLYSEIMLFAGLFVLYATYFYEYHADFAHAGKELSLFFGTLNTGLLLVSSFAVAAAITAVRRGQPKRGLAGVLAAIAMGGVFLVNKYFEWSHKIHHGIYPNSPKLLEGPRGETMFYSLYYVITGLHGIHIIIGMIVLSVAAGMLAKGRIRAGHDTVLDNAGLYWHLVDLIWIFIFPLFYLVL